MGPFFGKMNFRYRFSGQFGNASLWVLFHTVQKIVEAVDARLRLVKRSEKQIPLAGKEAELLLRRQIRKTENIRFGTAGVPQISGKEHGCCYGFFHRVPSFSGRLLPSGYFMYTAYSKTYTIANTL